MKKLTDESYTSLLGATLLCALMLSSCIHSPRSQFFDDQEKTEIKNTKKNPGTTALPAERFRDTSYQRIIALGTQPVQSSLAAAQADFDDRRFDDALKTCQRLIETIDETDSLHAEARLLMAQCHVQKSQFAASTELLQSIVKQHTAADALRERALLLLGQSYCLQNTVSEAKATFQRFRTEFPKSTLLGLANCDQLKR